MPHRFCPDCQRWYSDLEYEYDETGWIICPDCGLSLHGYIDADMRTESDLRRNLRISHPSKYLAGEVEAAKAQDLIRS